MWSSSNDRRRSRAAAPRAATRDRAVRLAAAALAGLASGCVLQPVRHFRSGVERVESGNTKLTSQSNLLELAVQDRPAADLEYRIDDKILYSDQSISTASADTDDASSQHRPSLELAITNGPLEWSQLYQRQEDRFLFDDGPDNRQVRQDILQKLEWTPEDLPQVSAWIDFRSLEDDFFVDEDRIETFLRVYQQIDAFGYDYSFRKLYTQEHVRDTDTDRIEHIARGSYSERHVDDRLSTTLAVFVAERSTDIEVPLGGTGTLNVVPLETYSDVDLTPQVSTLTPNPALRDGNIATPTGIDIGGFASGGQLSWNIAAEIQTGDAVDVVELVTASPVPPTFTGQFSFSAWVSDDNVFWTLVQGSSAYVYDQALQRFRISIPTVSRRYVKVVNTSSPAAAPAVLVTEMVLLRNSSAPGSTRRSSDERVRNVTGNTSWRASEEVSLGLDVFAQQADADTDGSRSRDETRLDVGAWTTWAPTERIDGTLRVSNQRIDDPLLRDENLFTVLAAASYRPLRTLDVDLSYNDSDRDVDGDDDTHTRAAALLASAQLLMKLRAEAGLERNVLDDSTNQREIARWITTAALIAEVTSRWEVTLRARNDDADVSGAGASAIPSPSEDRYELTVVYRPAEQFIAEAELEWVDTFAGQGLDERLRFDWIPFGDGSLDIQLDFDRTTTRSFSDMQIDRYRALTRWSLAATTYLELQYVAEKPDNGPDTDILTFAFSYRN